MQSECVSFPQEASSESCTVVRPRSQSVTIISPRDSPQQSSRHLLERKPITVVSRVRSPSPPRSPREPCTTTSRVRTPSPPQAQTPERKCGAIIRIASPPRTTIVRSRSRSPERATERKPSIVLVRNASPQPSTFMRSPSPHRTISNHSTPREQLGRLQRLTEELRSTHQEDPLLDYHLASMGQVSEFPTSRRREIAAVRVRSVSHPRRPQAEFGYFFYFDVDAWSQMIGAQSHADWTGRQYHVSQTRDGNIIWDGKVCVCYTPHFGAWGHTIETNSYSGECQWNVDDVICMRTTGKAEQRIRSPAFAERITVATGAALSPCIVSLDIDSGVAYHRPDCTIHKFDTPSKDDNVNARETHTVYAERATNPLLTALEGVSSRHVEDVSLNTRETHTVYVERATNPLLTALDGVASRDVEAREEHFVHEGAHLSQQTLEEGVDSSALKPGDKLKRLLSIWDPSDNTEAPRKQSQTEESKAMTQSFSISDDDDGDGDTGRRSSIIDKTEADWSRVGGTQEMHVTEQERLMGTIHQPQVTEQERLMRTMYQPLTIEQERLMTVGIQETPLIEQERLMKTLHIKAPCRQLVGTKYTGVLISSRSLERSVRAKQRTHGENHLEVAEALLSLARHHEAQGLHERHKETHERAMRIYEIHGAIGTIPSNIIARREVDEMQADIISKISIEGNGESQRHEEVTEIKSGVTEVVTFADVVCGQARASTSRQDEFTLQVGETSRASGKARDYLWESRGHGGVWIGYKEDCQNLIEKAYQVFLKGIGKPQRNVLSIDKCGSPLQISVNFAKCSCRENGVLAEIRRTPKMEPQEAKHDATFRIRGISLCDQEQRILMHAWRQEPRPDRVVLSDGRVITNFQELELDRAVCGSELLQLRLVVPIIGSVSIPDELDTDDGILFGTQPPIGTLSWHLENFSLPGHPRAMQSIHLKFNFPAGTTPTGEHYVKREPFCYLPRNVEGLVLLELYIVAFRRRVMFGFGAGSRDGALGATFNIRIKTSKGMGTGEHDYPDDGYFKRSLEELRDKGVTIADLGLAWRFDEPLANSFAKEVDNEDKEEVTSSEEENEEPVEVVTYDGAAKESLDAPVELDKSYESALSSIDTPKNSFVAMHADRGVGAFEKSVGEQERVYVEKHFNDRGDATLNQLREYKYQFGSDYLCTLSKWTYSRKYARGFVLDEPGRSASAVVSHLKAGCQYAWKVYQYASEHPCTNPLSVNGICQGTTSSNFLDAPTAEGFATADSKGKITFTFTVQSGQVHLSGIAIATIIQAKDLLAYEREQLEARELAEYAKAEKECADREASESAEVERQAKEEEERAAAQAAAEEEARRAKEQADREAEQVLKDLEESELLKIAEAENRVREEALELQRAERAAFEHAEREAAERAEQKAKEEKEHADREAWLREEAERQAMEEKAQAENEARAQEARMAEEQAEKEAAQRFRDEEEMLSKGFELHAQDHAEHGRERGEQAIEEHSRKVFQEETPVEMMVTETIKEETFEEDVVVKEEACLLVVSGAGHTRANGRYMRSTERKNNKEVWIKESDPEYRIQWSTVCNSWTIDYIHGNTPYKCLSGTETVHPEDAAEWTTYQGGEYPNPTVRFQAVVHEERKHIEKHIEVIEKRIEVIEKFEQHVPEEEAARQHAFEEEIEARRHNAFEDGMEQVLQTGHIRDTADKLGAEHDVVSEGAKATTPPKETGDIRQIIATPPVAPHTEDSPVGKPPPQHTTDVVTDPLLSDVDEHNPIMEEDETGEHKTKSTQAQHKRFDLPPKDSDSEEEKPPPKKRRCCLCCKRKETKKKPPSKPPSQPPPLPPPPVRSGTAPLQQVGQKLPETDSGLIRIATAPPSILGTTAAKHPPLGQAPPQFQDLALYECDEKEPHITLPVEPDDHAKHHQHEGHHESHQSQSHGSHKGDDDKDFL